MGNILSLELKREDEVFVRPESERFSWSRKEESMNPETNGSAAFFDANFSDAAVLHMSQAFIPLLNRPCLRCLYRR